MSQQPERLADDRMVWPETLGGLLRPRTFRITSENLAWAAVFLGVVLRIWEYAQLNTAIWQEHPKAGAAAVSMNLTLVARCPIPIAKANSSPLAIPTMWITPSIRNSCATSWPVCPLTKEPRRRNNKPALPRKQWHASCARCAVHDCEW